MSAPRNVLLLLSLLVATSAVGQPVLDTLVVLPDVTVSATRSQTSAARAPSAVTLLSARDIAVSGAGEVGELLMRRSPVFVKRLGSTGLASMSVRGTGASQTLILLDGQRIADPQLGQLDLSQLPASVISSVEVLGGAASPLYGTDALGGVISIRSLSPGEAPVMKVHTGIGAFGEREGGIAVSGSSGPVAALAAVDVGATDGDFPYLNKALFPARETRRRGADMLQRSLYSTLAYAAGRHEARIGAWYHDAETGLPGPGAALQSSSERQWDEHLRFWANDRVKLGGASLRLGALVQRGALRYANPLLSVDDTGRTLIGSGEAELTMRPTGHWLPAFGLAAGWGQARHPSLRSVREGNAAAFAHATGSYGLVLLYPALRVDHYMLADNQSRTAVSPRLGVNVQPFAGLPLFARASAGRSFRMPTFNDRYWRPGGDADLRPEHGWSVDAGAVLKNERGMLDVGAFRSRMEDEIVWVPAGSYSAARNFRNVLRYGVEAKAERSLIRRPGLRLDAGFVYAYTRAIDQSDPNATSYGRQLRYVPRQQVKVYLNGRLGAVGADLGGQYVGARLTGASEMNAYFVADARLHVTFRAGTLEPRLALAIENLLDARYAVVDGYPMPPRYASLRLQVCLNR